MVSARRLTLGNESLPVQMLWGRMEPMAINMEFALDVMHINTGKSLGFQGRSHLQQRLP